jgi:hypothetical protein
MMVVPTQRGAVGLGGEAWVRRSPGCVSVEVAGLTCRPGLAETGLDGRAGRARRTGESGAGSAVQYSTVQCSAAWLELLSRAATAAAAAAGAARGGAAGAAGGGGVSGELEAGRAGEGLSGR